MLRILSIVLLLSFSAPALAIYKCQSGEKISYSDVPCPSGKFISLDDTQGANAAAADAARARQRAAQEKNEAARLEKARHQREASDEKEQRQAARVAVVKKQKCATLAQRQKWSEEDAAHAAGRSAEKTKRKARRAKEKYDMECKGA